MEDEETSESEAALYLGSGQFVNLFIGQVPGTPTQSEFHAPRQ